MFFQKARTDLRQVPVSPEDPLPVTTKSGSTTAVTAASGAFAAGSIADGADVTQGTKADAAATDSTSSWSVIALLKGIIAQLLSTNPAQVYRSDSYQNITAAAPTTTTVKSGAGTLSKIVINKAAATGVITIYDNTAASGTVIATITQPAAVLASQNTLQYDVAFAIGLTIVTATAAQDITVCYR